MARVSKRVKITILVVAGVIASGVYSLYQKLFGGPVRILPVDETVVGRKPMPSQKPETAKEIIAVARAETPATGVDEVIAKTGGLDFITPGQKVLIKPNVNSDDPAPGTTHPEVLAEVVRLVKARGAYVVVGDRLNFNYKTIPTMKKLGLYDAAKNAGADEIVGFENEEWVRVAPANAKNWPHGFRVPKRLSEFDHVISVPVLHTHFIAGHSLAIKNLVGLIHPGDRMLFHSSRNIQEMIAEISLAVRPSLTVIDGTRAFIAGGPATGTLAQPKAYIASRDTLAADVAGVVILKKSGAKLNDDVFAIPQIAHFLNLGLSGYTRQIIESKLEGI